MKDIKGKQIKDLRNIIKYLEHRVFELEKTLELWIKSDEKRCD